MKRVSIIVTSYNNAHNLEACIQSILAQKYDKENLHVQIIFVDSGSTDISDEILHRYESRITIIHRPPEYPITRPLSPAEARNIGASHADGEIFLFTDSDCVVLPTWMHEMLTSFKKDEIECVIGSREPDIGQGYGTFIRRYDSLLFSNKYTFPRSIFTQEIFQQRKPFVLLAANNLGIRADLWKRIGGMKTSFRHPAGEDVLLEIEILQLGSRVLFNPQSIVRHFHPVSFLKLLRRAIQNGEATYLLSRYSNGLVGWKVFAERGHNFPMPQFIGSIGITLLLLLLITGMQIPTLMFFLIVGSLFSLFMGIQVYKIHTRMRRVLLNQSEEYQRRFSLGVGGLCAFVVGHSILRSISSISFLWYSLL